jgi:hypothetical protein
VRDSVGSRGRHNFTINNYGFGASGLVFLRVTSELSAESNTCNDTGGTASHSDFHHAFSMANLVDNSLIKDQWFCRNRRDWSDQAGMTGTQNTFWNNRGGTTGDRTLLSWQFDIGYVIGTRDLTVITANAPGGDIHYKGTKPDDYTEFLDLAPGSNLSPTSLYEEQRARRLLGK